MWCLDPWAVGGRAAVMIMRSVCKFAQMRVCQWSSGDAVLPDSTGCWVGDICSLSLT